MAGENRKINDLLLRCADDMDSLGELYSMMKLSVYGFAFSIVRDHSLAEECVQETFVRLPGAAARYTPGPYGKTFILAITKYAALELARKRDRSPPAAQWEPAYTDDGFTGDIAAKQLLEALSEDQRQIVMLHLFSDLTFDAVAQLTQTPVSTVKSRYASAKKTLRQFWKDERA